MKLRGGETKRVLKRAVEDFVPHEILYREKKGFGIPLDQWINRELRDEFRETLTDSRARSRGYFDHRHIDSLFDEHERGRRDHSAQLWALFVLELWHREYIDGGQAASRATGHETAARELSPVSA